MSWITVVWSMVTAACLSFAAVHLLVWLHSRDARPNLLFAISAAAGGALTMQELLAFRATTPAAYGEAVRWMHVAAAVVVIALVWFVRSYLRAGRIGLAWAITGLRALVLVPNFFAYPNATFGEITAVAPFSLLGEPVSVPVGQPNPWRFLIHASVLLLLIYVVDAAAGAWRQGERRRGLVIGGAIVAAALLSAVNSQLVVLGLLPGPFTGLVFLLIVIAMGWELSLDLIRAGELARNLSESQQRVELVTRAADLGLWEWDVERDEVWVNEGVRAWVGLDASGRVTLDGYLRRIQLDDREATREADPFEQTGAHYSGIFYVKRRLKENEAGNAGWAVSVGTGVDPSHLEAGTVTDTFQSWFVNTSYTVAFADGTVTWDLLPGVTVNLNRDRRSEKAWGMTWCSRAAVYKIIPQSAIVGEVFGTAGEAYAEPSYRVGVRWESPPLVVAATYGNSFSGSGSPRLEIGAFFLTK